MSTLYRKFSSAMLLILCLSVIVGFALANVIYFSVAKEKIDGQNVETAQGIAEMLFYDHYEEVLQSMASLGYQLVLVDDTRRQTTYGDPFDKEELPNSAIDMVLAGEVYHGMQHFTGSLLMMDHFSNDAENTVGVPFTMNGEDYGLFLRPDSQILFSDMHAILVGFIVAVALVSLLGVFLMTRHIIKPVSELTAATKAIANDKFRYELNVRSNDEIGQLADSFRTMQQQLEHNQAATKAFISNVSHDFQSPLMNIQGYAELLQNGVTEQERVEYSGIIDRESKRLSNLTRQLLLLTSLDQPAFPLSKQRVRIDTQLREIIRKYRWRVAECDIELSYRLDEVTADVDAELMMNVWDNILSNAFKYTNYTNVGTIQLTCKRENTHVVVTCEDTGIGLTPEQAERVFDRFYRVDQARKRDGTGLGLSICQEIIELHDGTIHVESEYGYGTKVVVTLPILCSPTT